MDIPDKVEAGRVYRENLPNFARGLTEFRKMVEDLLTDLPINPSYKSRIKNFESLFKKRIKLLQRLPAGSSLQITDLLGIRVICPFLEDLKLVVNKIASHFEMVEVERKGSELSFKEFGYESIHLLVKVPDCIELDRSLCPVIEVQVRTILQDAWAEVEHELVYKAEFNPFDEPMKRKLAALNANLSLSDMIFQEIRDYQHQLNNELLKRRETFFTKVERSMESLAEGIKDPTIDPAPPAMYQSQAPSKDTIDTMILDALLSHNNNDFPRAIAIYSSILDQDPKDEIRAIIYKHRGMAYFAENRYDEAIQDFSESIKLAPANARAYYFRAVVYSVKSDYGRAIADFDASISLNPYQFYALYRRAQSYYHIGDPTKALADCDQALHLEPDSKNALRFREFLLTKLKM